MNPPPPAGFGNPVALRSARSGIRRAYSYPTVISVRISRPTGVSRGNRVEPPDDVLGVQSVTAMMWSLDRGEDEDDDLRDSMLNLHFSQS